MESLQVRTARLSEVAEIGDLMRRSVEGLSQGFYDDRQRELAARYLTVPDVDLIVDRTYFVVEADGRLCGAGGWSARRKLFTGSAEQEGLSADWLEPGVEAARIRAFFVDPAFARRGIGRLIYDACETSARERGFRTFELMATLPGVPFYGRLGFEANEEEAVLLPSGDRLPCVRMSRMI